MFILGFFSRKGLKGIAVPAVGDVVRTCAGEGTKLFVCDSRNCIIQFCAGDVIEITNITPAFRKSFKLSNNKSVLATFQDYKTLTINGVLVDVQNLNRRLSFKVVRLQSRPGNVLLNEVNIKEIFAII
jgi:hypothetical protein